VELTVEKQDGIHIVRIAGRLDGTTSSAAESEIVKLSEAGCRNFLFDLTELEYISSAGLRVMLLAAKKARAAGGKAAVFGMNGTIREIFSISGFLTIFPDLPSREEGLRHMAEPPQT